MSAHGVWEEKSSILEKLSLMTERKLRFWFTFPYLPNLRAVYPNRSVQLHKQTKLSQVDVTTLEIWILTFIS